jgi:hypothetical protein
MDFCSLQHVQDSAIHCSRGFQARYGPRSGFGHPLRGFRPPNPGRLCFTPAALVGFALRSFLLRRGGRCVSARRTPLAVFLVGKRPARWRGAGPTSRGFWGFSRAQVPGDRRGISSPTAGCSLGLCPLRVSQSSPRSRFSSTSSHTLCRSGSCERIDRRPRVSLGDNLAATVDRDRSRAAATTLAGFPRQFVPQPSENLTRRAYCFASRRVAHCCRPTGRSLIGCRSLA